MFFSEKGRYACSLEELSLPLPPIHSCQRPLVQCTEVGWRWDAAFLLEGQILDLYYQFMICFFLSQVSFIVSAQIEEVSSDASGLENESVVVKGEVPLSQSNRKSVRRFYVNEEGRITSRILSEGK